LPERRNIKDVKKVIAVSSAKGGVGKSTIAGSDSVQRCWESSKQE
jgi:Mrp family chromosome partitioning ATPase